MSTKRERMTIRREYSESVTVMKEKTSNIQQLNHCYVIISDKKIIPNNKIQSILRISENEEDYTILHVK